jgi:hypothetical protein
MNMEKMERALRRNPLTGRHFLGVFARDRLPKMVPTRQAFSLVANTDPERKSGMH